MSTASTSGLSASVTRILSLSGFPKELKTKDIQSAFAEWESMGGGFRIKWRDDTSLFIVFQDASVAKRAYLHTLAFPPAILTTNCATVIKPYDGSDAQLVIQAVNARNQHHNGPRSGGTRAASISVWPGRTAGSQNGHVVSASGTINGREPSPTLPTLPSHPSLNDLINSSMVHEDPAIIHAEGPPRIGDPGKRMLGAALGVRHPGLGPRTGHSSVSSSPSPNTLDPAVHKAIEALTLAEKTPVF